jgi:hypothetical protein
LTTDEVQNPFIVLSPEDIEAAEALRLFVDVFTDFHKVRDRGHTMVNGPRGCGKSMMFRYLLPDCQCLRTQRKLHELDFFAVPVPIKNTTVNITELLRLRNQQANIILNEQLLTMYVASRTFATLSKLKVDEDASGQASVKQLRARLEDRLRFAGWSGRRTVTAETGRTISDTFESLKNLFDELYTTVIISLRSVAFSPDAEVSYKGPLCGYLDFLLPMFENLRSLSFMPKGPIYLLIDDADYLNLIQTRILNTWLSTRTSASVSIKISTQLKYKSFQTVPGMRVDSPHDYSEVNVSDLYTTSRGKYKARVEEIVAKRLEYVGLNPDPRVFFPEDKEQELEIKRIAEELRQNWHASGRGSRPDDDATRYARPIFIAGLGGKRRAGSSYSYAGFDQLVHISSGLIRYFLEPAARMFAEQLAVSKNEPVIAVSPKIQDEIVRDEADRLMYDKFDEIFKEEQEHSHDERYRALLRDNKVRLHNLIRALGGIFHAKLVSDDAERRVFSVAFRDSAAPDVLEIFNLGMTFGYFHRSAIGNKDGTGRTPLYVLTRRLAPHFNLDPTGFAGYLFVTSERLREAIADPDRFLRRVRERGVAAEFEERQLALFEGV